MTTTVEPESTPTDSTPTYEEESAASTPSSVLSTKLPEKGVDSAPSDVVDAPAPSQPASSDASTTTPTDLPVDTATPPTDSAGSGNYGSGESGSEDTGSGNSGSGNAGSDLPGGMSLDEFLDWFKQALSQLFSSDGRRKHARDLSF